MQVTGSNSPQSAYRLSIHVLVDGFSVSVDDSDGQQMWYGGQSWTVAAAQGRAEALRAVLAGAQVSSHPYARVEVVSHAPSTYVPVELFRRTDMASVYRLTFSNQRVGNADLRHRILPGMEVVEIYSMPQPIAQAVAELYPQAEMGGRAGQVVALAAAREHERPVTGERMHVCVDSGEMHVCLFDDGLLRFACTYPATSDADRIYYLMAVWRTLGLDAMHTPCLLTGDAATLRSELKNYIMNVDTCA